MFFKDFAQWKRSNSAFITSYERDNETELDFAQARMFSYGHGRFTSPDNFLNDTSQIEPKSWNLYVYVLNNPMNSVDPLGEQVQVALPKDADQRKKVKEEILKRLNYTYDCDGCVTIDDNGGYKKICVNDINEHLF